MKYLVFNLPPEYFNEEQRVRWYRSTPLCYEEYNDQLSAMRRKKELIRLGYKDMTVFDWEGRG